MNSKLEAFLKEVDAKLLSRQSGETEYRIYSVGPKIFMAMIYMDGTFDIYLPSNRNRASKDPIEATRKYLSE